MKKIVFSSLYLLSFFMMTSCIDLDEEVYSDITENSYLYQAGNATDAVGAIYSNLQNLYTNTARTQEVSADAIVMPANPVGGWDDGGIYRRMHLHMWNSEQDITQSFWNSHFKGITLSNRVLQQLLNGIFPLTAKENEKRLIAEVRTLRAYHYWIIMDNWDNPPLKIDDTNDLPANSSRKEIFDFITSEIIASLNDLPTEKTQDTYGRFTKWAAHSLLANIYLNAEVYTGTVMWDKCIEECNAIISSGKYQLDEDYRTPFLAHNEVSLENILVVPFDEIYADGFQYYRDALHRANKDTYNLEATPSGTGVYKGIPQFIDTYDPEDDRYHATWLYGQQYKANGDICVGFQDLNNLPLIFENKMPNGIQVGEGKGLRWLKYEIEFGARNGLNNDWVIFRYAQVLMMKAECLLRTGKADEAASIVSEVRQRAFKDNPEKAIVKGTQLQEPSSYVYGKVENYVLTPQSQQLPEKYGRFYDELGWEFVGEFMRRRDMIRFGHYTKAIWLSHEPAGDYRTVFPIPQKTLDANINLEQNPNYQ